MHPLQKLQDRVPGEPFAAKPSKDAEMERILKSMEVNVLAVTVMAFFFVWSNHYGFIQVDSTA